MASLIRLKQIESSSYLTSASVIGLDFNNAVYEIIDGAGIFSSSQQVDLVSASNYDGFVVQLDLTMSSDLEASIISSSISQSISVLSQTLNEFTESFSSSMYLELSSSAANVSLISSSLDSRIDALEQFSSSLDQTFATDAEVEYTASNIIDQGEW